MTSAIVFESHPARLYDQYNLTCSAQMDPPPSVRWYYNDKLIPANYSHSTYSQNEVRSSLVVTLDSYSQFGSYKCQAYNELVHKDVIVHSLERERNFFFKYCTVQSPGYYCVWSRHTFPCLCAGM